MKRILLILLTSTLVLWSMELKSMSFFGVALENRLATEILAETLAGSIAEVVPDRPVPVHDSIIEITIQNIEEAKKESDDALIIAQLLDLCDYYIDGHDLKNANTVLLDILKYPIDQYKDEAADFYILKGRFHMNNGNFEEALPSFYTALRLIEEHQLNICKQSVILYYIGMVNFENNNFKEGQKYCFKSIEMQAQCPNDSLLVIVYNGLGFGERDFAKSNRWFFKSLDIIKRNDFDFESTLLGNMYHNMASNYGALGIHDSSEYFFQKSYASHKRHQFHKGLIYHHLNVGQVNYEHGNYTLSESHLDSAKKLIDEQPSDEYYVALYRNYAKLYKNKGDLERAYESLEKRNSYAGRVYSFGLKEKISSIKSTYELEKENVILKNKYQIKDLEAKRNELQRNLLIAGFGFGIIVIVLLIFQVRYHIKSKKKAENLKTLLNKIEDTLIVLDTKGRVEWTNKYVKNLLSKPFSKLDISVLESSFLMSGLSKYFQECLDKKEVIYYTNSYQKDGKTLYWQITIFPIFDKNGNISQVVIKDSDITKIMEIENELQTKNKELKKTIITRDKFFSVVSHDLRSPIKSFLKVSKFLIDPTKKITEETRNEMTSSLTESAEYMYDLLENLLNWSISQTGGSFLNPGYFSVEDVVSKQKDYFDKLSKSKFIRIHTSVMGDTSVYADKNMIDTVIRNLITNAIKFTNKYGHIDIKIIEQQYYVDVIVTDDGIGMSDSIQKKLFKIEEKISTPGTNEEKGTGLGLLLCKEYVENNKGELSFNSKKNEGSTFIVKLRKQPWER